MKKRKNRTIKSLITLGLGLIIATTVFFAGCGKNESGVAGFELPHNDGLDTDGMYDASNFYLNEQRTDGADPGVMYVSSEEAEDSYHKLKANAKARAPESFDEAEWEEKNGDLEYWKSEYGNKFFMAVTGNGSVTTDLSTNYGSKYIAYRLFRSATLTDWQTAGRLDGYALNVRSNGWCANNFWAPELIRDPVSGRFFLFASAGSRADGNSDTEFFPNFGTWNYLYGLIAMADNPMGPYELISSDEYYRSFAAYDEEGNLQINNNREVLGLDGQPITTVDENGNILNRNGNVVTSMTPPVNMGRYCNSISSDPTYYYRKDGVKAHDTSVWPIIDLHPFIDGEDMYLYFARHTSDYTTEDGEFGRMQYLDGVKMIDFCTPNFNTYTALLKPNADKVEKINPNIDGDIHNFKATGTTSRDEGTVNEGPFVVAYGGKYYMTYSPLGYTNRAYSIMQAVSDSPLGPFEKIDEYGPIVGASITNDYMTGTGHSSIVKAGNEYFCVYHALQSPVGVSPGGIFLGRSIGVDRVQFAYNEQLGYDIMYGNGPTYSLQPLPEVATGRTNVAKLATITADGNSDTVKYLNDGLFTVQDFSYNLEYVAPNKDNEGTTITLKWSKPVSITSLVIYNSQSYFTAFDKIDYVTFKIAEKPAWYNLDEFNGYCYIKNLQCNPYGVKETDFVMRQGCGALASFNEICVTEMTIHISSKYTQMSDDESGGANYEIRVSDIYVSGKEAA